MKWTALLAVAAFLLAVGSASAAPKAIKGTVVAKRAHTIVLTTGHKGIAVTFALLPGACGSATGSASSGSA